jgi:hypothetical protein
MSSTLRLSGSLQFGPTMLIYPEVSGIYESTSDIDEIFLTM